MHLGAKNVFAAPLGELTNFKDPLAGLGGRSGEDKGKESKERGGKENGGRERSLATALLTKPSFKFSLAIGYTPLPKATSHKNTSILPRDALYDAQNASNLILAHNAPPIKALTVDWERGYLLPIPHSINTETGPIDSNSAPSSNKSLLGAWLNVSYIHQLGASHRAKQLLPSATCLQQRGNVH